MAPPETEVAPLMTTATDGPTEDSGVRLANHIYNGWKMTGALCKKCGTMPLLKSPKLAGNDVCVNCDLSTVAVASPVVVGAPVPTESHFIDADDLGRTMLPPMTLETMKWKGQTFLAASEGGAQPMKAQTINLTGEDDKDRKIDIPTALNYPSDMRLQGGTWQPTGLLGRQFAGSHLMASQGPSGAAEMPIRTEPFHKDAILDQRAKEMAQQTFQSLYATIEAYTVMLEASAQKEVADNCPSELLARVERNADLLQAIEKCWEWRERLANLTRNREFQ